MNTRPRSSLAVLVLAAVALAAAPGRAPAGERAHPKGGFVTVLGKKIWWESDGKGEPLLLIPGGGGGSHDYYHPYFSALAASFRVVYYDGFGRGKSDRAKSPDEYSFDRDIEEVEALRKALGLGRIHVLGHSYGGLVAQAYALKYPDSIRSLILSNTFVSGEDYQASNVQYNKQVEFFLPEVWARVAQLRSHGYTASSPPMQEAYLGKIATMLELFYFYDPANAARIVFDEQSFNAEEYYAITGPDADFELGPQIRRLSFGEGLSKLRAPILVLIGRSDGVVFPKLALNIARSAPRAEVVIFEKSGHFPFIEETDKMMATIGAFLRK
jgi:proline iminopeptidase